MDRVFFPSLHISAFPDTLIMHINCVFRSFNTLLIHSVREPLFVYNQPFNVGTAPLKKDVTCFVLSVFFIVLIFW